MKSNNHIPHLYKPLLPLAWLYGAGVWMRNRLFDRGILSAEEFSIPIISVGNINVGGTGKTPMIEHLIELLSPHKRIAVLSRGYRRKSKGFVLAHPQSTAQELGDEPYQIHSKYKQVTVAVDANRRRGIKQLLQLQQPPEVILLDDAHQHRYVRPTLSIVLCDHNRPPYADLLLPAGRLREPISGLQRADMVVLTKCKHLIDDKELRNEAQRLNIDADTLYTAHIEYGMPYNIANKEQSTIEQVTKEKHVIVFTGIANPQPLVAYLSRYTTQITTLNYPDHHDFTSRDIDNLVKQMGQNNNTIIITTEKDAARLACAQLPSAVHTRCYVMPLKTVIQPSASHTPFDRKILEILSIAPNDL